MTALQVNCRVLISDWNSIKRTERQPLECLGGKKFVFRKSGLHMSAIELSAHEFKNLGGAQGLGHDYRGMN